MINLTYISASPQNLVVDNGDLLYITYSLTSTQPILSIGLSYGSVVATDIFDISDYEKTIQVSTSSSGSIVLSASNIISETTSIETSGIDSIYGDKVNLVDFIPSHLRQWQNGQPSEFEQFIKFFEDYLNTMYEQRDGSYVTILEKIRKLGDMHDADEIDYEYINFFATYLGFDIGISKQIISAINGDDEESENTKRQIRQIVRELPNWYKIKSTRNAIKIMLYSFGIIAEMKQYYTTPDYYSNFYSYVLDSSNNNSLEDVPDNYIPIPHFSLSVDLLNSLPEWVTQIENIIKLIDDVKPINVVLDRVVATLIVSSSESSTAVSMAASKVVQQIKIPKAAQVN